MRGEARGEMKNEIDVVDKFAKLLFRFEFAGLAKAYASVGKRRGSET